MKKVNIKVQTVIWTIVVAIALFLICICSFLIYKSNSVLYIKSVSIEESLKTAYQVYKAYSIGILLFSIILFIIGSAISYLGFRSWTYNATL
ncbi:Uncharacterised protein [Mycoplasmopsis maculosa]|uniref:Uncharacterized protein n=1 Tax=Mycoplasmopsis maculosa TaxID=114885 RepID=A0A449B4I3_9BACT|nr:hypothetical protein [Mycoplasmopsis maculosa]VEU75475.1 Uncharacterised protein [Mycoplasmopsis maculosa]